ncbi:MAG: N-acetylmuramoyl-L-alanine amidase, partial [Halanaerobiaceae bacterium]|nr:N-acetylmuramoyl-L-alanine amidase [Halanaerobiaceae bacterium]
HTYIPVEDIAQCFGFLYNKENGNIYLSRPESYVQNISWQKEGQRLIVELDKMTPYRINNTGNPRIIELELEKTVLAENFSDDLSNRSFFLRTTQIENEGRLKISIISQHPIPFQRDRCIEEDGNKLIINFLPSITGISWKNNQLEIMTNGVVSRPEIMLLTDPRRLVIDIPDLMLNDFDLELADNEWIKDIRVSQFQYDPIVLRVVLELYPDRYLHLAEDAASEGTIVLRPTARTILDNLSYEKNSLKFISDNKINPEVFKIKDPNRLVIDILNADRGKNFPDKIEVNDKLVKGIRSSRFNEETIRIVADLNQNIGYSLKEEYLPDGRIMNIVSFENNIQEMLINDTALKTDVVMNFTGEVNYEVKKFSFPDRVVVDIKGVDLTEGCRIPEPVGVVRKINISAYEAETQITRIEFETGEYNNYRIFSQNPDSSISLSFIKEEQDREDISNIIVIDAGHGGFDPGAIGPSGLEEKTINLELALKVENILKTAGYNVRLTRKDDTFISLKDRVEFANKLNAMLFVSIHINSANSPYSEGTETFIAPDKAASSLLLANCLQDKMLEELRRVDRGVKKENFYVIKYTKMPAALVEVAFLSNPHEESLLASNLFKEKAARAIAQGIIDYIKKINNGR